MNLDDDLRAALGAGDEPPAGDGFDDVRARAGRLRRRRRVRRVGTSVAAVAVVVGGVVAGTARDPQNVVVGDGTVTTPPESTVPDTPTTEAPPADPDAAAAAAFIDAWGRGDAEAMRQLGDAQAVDVALAFGNARGAGSCSSQPNGQYQCIVEVPNGKRAYILVGEPGTRPGHVWWVSEYHPDA